MKIHLVCYEDLGGWILGKISTRLCENINTLGYSCDISKTVDHSADINHHIIYYDYNGMKSTTDTVMITHINTDEALAKVKFQLVQAKMGICFSEETVLKLAKLGVPRDRLCYISPAHDEVMRPRKTVLGITSKIHNDGRKREGMVVEIAEKLNPNEFEFKIMGMGWESIVASLRAMNFSVEYIDHFDYELNKTLVPSFDYYLYLGLDEGAMGFIDALAAGVPTIATAQGFHLDIAGGLTHPFTTTADLNVILESIANKKRKLVESVSNLTWRHFAKKHLDVWQYILNPELNQLSHDGIKGDGLLSCRDSSTVEIEEPTDIVLKVTTLLEQNRILDAQNFLIKTIEKKPSNQIALDIYQKIKHF